MYQVDLNSDLGESFGAYTIGLDQDVIAHVSSANIACGYHAGDPLVMDLHGRAYGLWRRRVSCLCVQIQRCGFSFSCP